VLDILKECGFTEDRFFIHCDGALFGMMMPFLKQAPMVTFRKPIGSVSVSGHKFVGAPVPCGVVITRFKYVMALSSDVEYLNSRDATIMGSRNGHAPIYLWYTLTRKGYEGMRQDVEKCMRNAHVLKDMLESAGIPTMLNELSNTVGGWVTGCWQQSLSASPCASCITRRYLEAYRAGMVSTCIQHVSQPGSMQPWGRLSELSPSAYWSALCT
jgi:hypothetical protein